MSLLDRAQEKESNPLHPATHHNSGKSHSVCELLLSAFSVFLCLIITGLIFHISSSSTLPSLDLPFLTPSRSITVLPTFTSTFANGPPGSSVFLSQLALSSSLPSPESSTPSPAPLTLSIFYNAFISHSITKWRALISAQLTNLVTNGLAAECSLLVVCISSDVKDADGPAGVFREAEQLIHSIVPHALIIPTAVNSFEYPAIYQMWQLAQMMNASHSDKHIMLYFHSKGMVNGGGGHTLEGGA